MRSRHHIDDSLRCSFCHRPQGVVTKLISSPNDYPRAYICNECIETCAAILEQDREPQQFEEPAEPHPLLDHPLASEFMASVVRWMMLDSLGQPTAEELGHMRTLASRMVSSSGTQWTE